MKRRIAIAVLVGFAIVVTLGVAQLFQWRLSRGDIFPEYSSLRDDPLGLGVLHDALSQLPEMRVERNLDPLEGLAESPARTIVLAGTERAAWSHTRREVFVALHAAVRGGSRLVIAFRGEAANRHAESAPEKPVPEKSAKRNDPKTKDAPLQVPDYVDLGRSWGAAPKSRSLPSYKGADRTADAPTALPAEITWASDVYFDVDAAAKWRVLYRRGGEPVIMERSLGQGTLVLAADAYFLSNEALQRDRSTPLLAWIVGPLHHVTFDESHLGVVVHPGVATLARRYGLWPACVSLLLLAGLFVWQRSAWFVPPPPPMAEIALTYHPAAGLHALLRRSVRPTEIVAASVAEWRNTAREADRRRMDQAVASTPKDVSLPEQYNLIDQALRRR